ncbi:MAG: hypothetical protein LBB20_01440 [Puniceicoccales bacterium]|nr:hypothetical protein [Puniceicoccales bacterium]
MLKITGDAMKINKNWIILNIILGACGPLFGIKIGQTDNQVEDPAKLRLPFSYKCYKYYIGTPMKPSVSIPKFNKFCDTAETKAMAKNHIEAILADNAERLAESYKIIRNKITEIKGKNCRKLLKHNLLYLRQTMEYYASKKILKIKHDECYRFICLKLSKICGLNPIPIPVLISVLKEKIITGMHCTTNTTDIDNIGHIIEHLLNQLYLPYTSVHDIISITKTLASLLEQLSYTELEYLVPSITEAIKQFGNIQN